MSPDPDCAFCNIVVGEATARFVYEDEFATAFLPLNPATAGHTLVVPREHVRDFFALPDSLARELLQAVRLVADGVRRAVRPDGVNLITSAGEAAQQTIFHLHVHVLPRWAQDRVGDIWPPDEPMDASDSDALRMQIASAVGLELDSRGLDGRC